MKRQIPIALTTLRLLLGPIAVLCAFSGVTRMVYLPILVTGTLSDIFDGILARRFGVSTSWLRRYDSVTDVIYYLFILAVALILCRPVILASKFPLSLLLASEVIVVLVSYARFGKYPATHSYLAKFYGLCLLAVVVALLVFNASSWVIVALAAVALVTNAEILAIQLLAKSQPVDVPGIFGIYKTRGGGRVPSA
jgi:CDP-diacylglycerol---glycerol-3-phosphate 3-phosphatidyltransferase